MNNNILSLSPTTLWHHFHQLTQIPRPSKKEARVAQYVINFGQSLGLVTETDKIGNVLIRKPATAGYANRPTVVLQAHLDMVPQKNNDTIHDFENDPIDAYVDGDWVRARGTTLGADNGIGVAAMLALLQATNIPHPPLEALFTIDEETGMTGAINIQPEWLTGSILINLDTEDDDELCIGCAGGLDASATLNYAQQASPGGKTYRLEIKGLKGGHSGVDIALGRANANKLAARVLRLLTVHYGASLVSFEGGTLRNAIPREAFASIVIPSEKEGEALTYLSLLAEAINKEYALTEGNISILLLPATVVATQVMAPKEQLRFLNAMLACPNGVARMDAAIPGLVETSNNMAIVRAIEGKASISCLMRSSVDSAKEHLAEVMEAVFDLAGFQTEFSGGYPGWQPNPNSPILSLMRMLYKDMFDKEPHVRAIHAGLECGLLGGVYPMLDMISCGPTIVHPHSPDEKVSVPSVERWWNYLLETLKSIPKL